MSGQSPLMGRSCTLTVTAVCPKARHQLWQSYSPDLSDRGWQLSLVRMLHLILVRVLQLILVRVLQLTLARVLWLSLVGAL